MTEEDTFNALRKSTFETIRDEYYNLKIFTEHNRVYTEFFKKHHWKPNEFMNEREKRRYGDLPWK